MFSGEFFINFLNSYSGGYLLEAVTRRYSMKKEFLPNSLQLYWKRDPGTGVLHKFGDVFYNSVSQNTSGRMTLICNFHKTCFSIECSSSCLNLMATANQIVITQLAAYGVAVITTAQLDSTKPEQVLRRFKPCSRRDGDSWWWGSLTMVPAGNKAKRFSSVNHTTKTIQFNSLVND